MVSWRRVWDWLTAGLRGFTKDATVMKSTGYLRRLIVFINSCWSRNDIHNPCIFHKVDHKFHEKSWYRAELHNGTSQLHHHSDVNPSMVN